MEVVLRGANLSKDWDQDKIAKQLPNWKNGQFEGTNFQEVFGRLRTNFTNDGIEMELWNESNGDFEIWKSEIERIVNRNIPPIISVHEQNRAAPHVLVEVCCDDQHIKCYDVANGNPKILTHDSLRKGIWRGDILIFQRRK